MKTLAIFILLAAAAAAQTSAPKPAPAESVVASVTFEYAVPATWEWVLERLDKANPSARWVEVGKSPATVLTITLQEPLGEWAYRARSRRTTDGQISEGATPTVYRAARAVAPSTLGVVPANP